METVRVGGAGGIMMWACFPHDGVEPIHRAPGIMDQFESMLPDAEENVLLK